MTMAENNKRKTWQIWWRAVRPHFVLSSILPALLGSNMAAASGHPFGGISFILVLMGVTANHCGLNLLDDYYDFRYAVDRCDGEGKNPFTGGSGVLPAGLLEPQEVFRVMVGCFVFTVITGLILTIRHGWPVLALGVFGVASAVFYTAPPIRFGYRGWGEVIMFVNFGPTLTLGAYYVQAGGVALEPLIVSLVPGLLMWSLIIINEIPDYEADRSGGKTNLVVRWGRERAVLLYLAGLGGAFTIVFTAVATGLSRPLLLLALVGLPWAVSSLGILKDHLYDPRAMAPANRAMLITYTVTITGLIGAYTIPLLF